MFGGYTVHLYAVGSVGTYGHSNDNVASSTTVGATVPLWCGRWRKLLCSSVVQTLCSDWHMYDPLLCYPPYSTAGADAARFLYGWCSNLYCATPPYHTVGADAARFLYGWRRDPLLCYPPRHYYCRGRCCPFFIRLAARSSTAVPPPTQLLGGPSLFYPPTLHLGFLLVPMLLARVQTMSMCRNTTLEAGDAATRNAAVWLFLAQ